MTWVADHATAPGGGRRFRAVADEPRRLLHVFPNFNVGGAQVRFIALAQALGERFHHAVVSLNGAKEACALLPLGAPIELLATPSAGGDLIARLKDHRELLAERGPDLLLTYNWGSMEVALANMVSRLPHIHMEDGFGPDESARRLRRRAWGRRLALRRSQVVVPSKTLETIAVRDWAFDPRRVHYIPNGIAPKLHAARTLRELGLNLPPALPVIAWAGALRPEKNPIRLLRAFAPIQHQAVLAVIGSGPEQEAVEREAAKLGLGPNLRLLGRRADVRDIIMQCQVVALSSDTEQMPMLILEAMDAGLPVAACDVGDVRRMVSAENRPFVCPVGDEALSQAMRALVQDAVLRARVGQANRRHVRASYTLGPMVEAYAALFDRVVARPPQGRRHA